MRFKETDLEITFLKGSGPGGQNRNKRETGVRIVHIPTGIVVMATERRSQGQNLEVAKERLEARLEKHFHRDAPRRKTKRTRGSQERRLEGKRVRSSVKRDRGKGSWD